MLDGYRINDVMGCHGACQVVEVSRLAVYRFEVRIILLPDAEGVYPLVLFLGGVSQHQIELVLRLGIADVQRETASRFASQGIHPHCQRIVPSTSDENP